MNIDLLLWLIIFIISLAVLIKASDYFVESAERVGIYIKIPSFIIGLTIVAMGTSLPETVSSIFAVINNSSEIVIGNVLGSNVANIFLVLGVVAAFSGNIKIEPKQVGFDLGVLVFSAILMVFFISDNAFTLAEGIIFLILLLGYLVYQVKFKNDSHDDQEHDPKIFERKTFHKSLLILFLNCIFIYFSSDYTIKSVIVLSELLNINKEFIAASAIALGTSLPELAVSISAMKRNYTAILIGNIIGSNIFNIFGTMGTASLFGTLLIPDNVFKILLPFMLLATFVFILNIINKKITKLQGIIYLFLYVGFIASMFFI